MGGTVIARHGRGFRFAAFTLVVATATVVVPAAGAMPGSSSASATSASISTPMLAASGTSDGYQISTVHIGVQAQAIAIDPGTHTVFVGSNELLTVVDEQTGTVTAAVQLPGSVVALAIDTATHRVYALQQFPQLTGQSLTAVQASIAVIDPSTLSVITTYPNLGSGPAFPSIGNSLVDDPVGHRLFNASVDVTLNGYLTAGATQTDTVSGAVTALAVSGVNAPNSVAYDASTQKLYVAEEGFPPTVTVVSVKGAPRNLASVKVGSQPDGIALDPSAQTAYVANNDGPSVSVIDAQTNQVVSTVAVGAILSGMGVDTSSHTLFAANGADGTVTVIDGATRTVTGIIQVGTPQYRVAVDPSTHSVWTTSLGTSITALNPIVARFAGADRFATAVAISANEYADDQADAVVLAGGDDYPDALAAVPLAAAKNGPLLFTAGATLPPVTEAEIRRVLAPGKDVYVLGAPYPSSDHIDSRLAALGYRPVRITGGPGNFATALAVADVLGDPSTIFLVSGTTFADALVAGPAAAKAHGAILLITPNGLAPETFSYLAAHPGTVFAIGGWAASADPTAIPIFGADRFETGMAVAQQFFAASTRAGVATASDFADALAAGAYMARIGGPLLLTQPTALSASAANYFESPDATVTSADIFGGSAALSAVVQTSTSAALVTPGG